MKTADIISIFPTPIYVTNINRKLTEKEMSFIKQCKKISHNNVGNVTSNNNYVLEDKAFKNLKNEINILVKDYYMKIVSINSDIIPYITQSWLNYTNKDQFHHKHEHPNSFVSGVFYPDCDQKVDSINFFNEVYKQIVPHPKEFNGFNSRTFTLPLKTGDIVLFPSSLTHMVETKKGNNTRTSLAFNTFMKGTMGSKSGLTELIL
jgi:uncharacterized protein (TIGR02466 family)